MSAKKLFPEERRQRILEMLEHQPKVHVVELAKEFGISQFTARADLDELERMGRLRRCRGGAMSVNGDSATSDYELRLANMSKEKRAIGAKAAEFVSSGDIIAVDTGTTTIELIRHLDPLLSVTIITNDFAICELAEERLRAAEVLFLGGFVHMGHHYTEGSQVMAALSHYHADKAFVSASGFTVEDGFMSEKPTQAQLKRGYLRSSRKGYVMMDESKVGNVSFAQFAQTSDVDGIITNARPAADILEGIHALNDRMMIAVAGER